MFFSRAIWRFAPKRRYHSLEDQALQELANDVKVLSCVTMRLAGHSYVPQKVGEVYPDLPFVEREHVIKKMFGHLYKTWTAPKFSADKADNPLIGFYAIPGGGKSYLIDNFVNVDFCQGPPIVNICCTFKYLTLDPVRQRYLPDEWSSETKEVFAQMWSNSLRISLTMNREFDMTRSMDISPRHYIAARLVHRCVV